MKKRVNVRAVRVHLFCDECGEEMLPTGVALASSPLQYPHACKNGHKINVRQITYPYIDFQEDV